MKATFDDGGFSYSVDGKEIEAQRVKGGADAIARAQKAEILLIGQRLQNEEISLQEAYDAAKREIKALHIAEAALARGGFENLRESDYAGISNIVAAQWNGVDGKFPGLRAFFMDIQNGRYGRETLGRGMTARLAQYAGAGRATYENERLRAQMQRFRMEARRVRGALDGCVECIAWAGLGWIDADEMLEKYPIGDSRCGGNCGCVIVTRRTKNNLKREAFFSAVADLLKFAGKGAAAAAAATAVVSLVAAAAFITNPVLGNAVLNQIALNARVLQNSTRSGALVPINLSEKGLELFKREHPFTPKGRSISKALAIPDEFAVNERIMEILDSIMGDGDLDDIEILPINRPSAKNLVAGKYVPGPSATLSLNVADNLKGTTMLHEIAHWIHDHALAPRRDYATGLRLPYKPNEELDKFVGLDKIVEAFNRTASGQQLRDWEKKVKTAKGKATIDPINKGKKVGIKYSLDAKHLEYLLRPEEIFARAFAQFIAMRSGDPQLIGEIYAYLKKPANGWGGLAADSLWYPTQWMPDDFAELDKLIEQILLENKWIQPQ